MVLAIQLAAVISSRLRLASIGLRSNRDAQRAIDLRKSGPLCAVALVFLTPLFSLCSGVASSSFKDKKVLFGREGMFFREAVPGRAQFVDHSFFCDQMAFGKAELT